MSKIHYPNDMLIFQPVYIKLDEMFENGELFSIREVFEELEDSQEYWGDYEECFRELTKNESKNLPKILYDKQFETFVKWGMRESKKHWADPQLIACAINKDIIIISQESSNNNPQRKIPYVCNKKGIKCIKLIEFLREIENI